MQHSGGVSSPAPAAADSSADFHKSCLALEQSRGRSCWAITALLRIRVTAADRGGDDGGMQEE